MNLRRFLFKKRLFRSFFSIALCILVCEFLIPFFYIFRCNWPINDLNDDFNLKAIVLSDTHLFGLKRGYFFDKFKREWNMYLAYQLAIRLFRPNSVLFLGDIFDEGLIADQKEFEKYSSRFYQLFSTSYKIDLIVSVGNHDVGFHDRMIFYDPFLRDRFEKLFNSSLVEHRTINGINIVNVNSMAMNGDHCDLCNFAEYQIEKLSSKLFSKCKTKSLRLCEEQRPILMSHFPLFRQSDLDCNELDSNYDLKEKSTVVSKKGCLSKRSTKFLLRKIQPRLSLNGHTHYGCAKKHQILLGQNNVLSIDEQTLSSFNYRNRPNPSFILLFANPKRFLISKCILPNEDHLFIIYSLLIFYLLYDHLLRLR